MSNNTINLDDYEKINFLFKNYLGFPNTDKVKPYYLENNVKTNNYLFGEELFLDLIPKTPNFNNTNNIKTAGDVSLTSNNFYNYNEQPSNIAICSIVEDISGIIRRYTKLKLTKIVGTNRGYYCLDSDNINILKDSLQFSKNIQDDGTRPYLYKVYDESDKEIPPDSNGGNWIFDVKNGVLNFPDEVTGYNVITHCFLTFYKYVGRKGIKKLNLNDLVMPDDFIFNNLDINNNLKVKGKTTLADISANDASFNNVDISSNIKVEGKTTLADLSANNTSLKNTDISGTLFVKERTTLTDLSANRVSLIITDINQTLNVIGKTTLTDLSANNANFNNVDVSNNLTITGKTTMKGDLDIEGDIKVNTINYNTENINIKYSNTIINDNIITLGLDASKNDLSYDTGFIFIDNNYNVLNKTLYWSQSEEAFIFGKTDSSGVTIDNASLSVNTQGLANLKINDLSANNTSLKNTDISGTLIVKDKTTLRDLSANNTSLKNTDISGTLIVKDKTMLQDLSANNTTLKNTDITGTLIVKDKTTLRDLSANNTSLKNTDISGTLNVKDKTMLQDLSANNTTLKNTDISGTLIVTGKTTLRDLSANNTSLKNTDISGTLNVKDKTTLRDLSANNTTLKNTDISGTLNVKDKTMLQDLSANNTSLKNTDISGTLIVTGKTTLRDLSANNTSLKNTDISGTLIVKDKTMLQDLSANNTSLKNTDISGTLIVKDKTMLQDLSANNTSLKNTDISGTLIVTGKTMLQDLSANNISLKNTDISGTLIVKDKTTLRDLSANNTSLKNTDISGTLNVKDKTMLQDLSANNTTLKNTDISGTLIVTGKTMLRDLSANDVSFNNIQFFGKLLDLNGNEFQSGSGGSGIDISGSSSGMLINEGKIIYDTSQNSFYEAVTLPTNTEPPTSVVFRELGYSFFKKNFEGSPPAPSFFFLINDITSVSITLRWKNPYQYPSGVSNNNDSYLNTNTSTINDQYNIYFPVVNRIMIQIKNLETNEYHKWGNFTSNTSAGIVDLSSARCICSKHYPIPPYTNSLSAIQPTASRTDIFNASLNNGRTNAVYKLDEFADSITLYSNNNSPSEADIATLRQEVDKIKRIYPGGDMESKELSASKNGYEILLWLENQYIKKDGNNNNIMTKDDFNIVDIRDQNGQYINFLKGNPPSEPLENEAKIVFSDNIGTNTITDVSENNTFIELKIKDPSFSTTTPSLSNEDLNKIIKFSAIKFEYSNTDLAISNNWVPCKKIFIANGVKNTFNDLNSDYQDITLDISGVWSVDSNPIKFTPRYNDNSNNTISSIYHYYYVKLDDAFLDVSNNEMEQYHKFRVSYKNGSQNDPELFGSEKESSTIQIAEPPQPTLSSVKMTNFNELTIKLKDMSANKIDSYNNPLDSNNNRAVFLRDISFNITRQYGGDSLPSHVTNISGLKGNWDSNNMNTTYNISNPILISSRTEGQDTDYIFTLPPGYLDPLKITDLSYNFNAQVKNNINNKWSVSSDILSIQITKPDMSNKPNIIFSMSEVSNNVLDISWNYPYNGSRGIVANQTISGLPKIQKFNLVSNNLEKINENGFINQDNSHNIVHNQRSQDAQKKISLSFYEAIKNASQNDYQVNFDLSVNVFNEYINNYSDISAIIDISAGNPSEVRDLSFDIILPTDKNFNFIDISWNRPNDSGLSFYNNNQRESARNTIIRYDISATRVKINNLLYSGTLTATTTIFESFDVSNNDNSIQKISITDASSNAKYVNLSTTGNMPGFVVSDSEYKIAVRSVNSFGLISDWSEKENSSLPPKKPLPPMGQPGGIPPRGGGGGGLF